MLPLATAHIAHLCAKACSVGGGGGGGGGGGYRPHIGLSTKMQNKKNNTFLAFLRLVFPLEWTKKWFKIFFEA